MPGLPGARSPLVFTCGGMSLVDSWLSPPLRSSPLSLFSLGCISSIAVVSVSQLPLTSLLLHLLHANLEKLQLYTCLCLNSWKLLQKTHVCSSVQDHKPKVDTQDCWAILISFPCLFPFPFPELAVLHFYLPSKPLLPFLTHHLPPASWQK